LENIKNLTNSFLARMIGVRTLKRNPFRPNGNRLQIGGTTYRPLSISLLKIAIPWGFLLWPDAVFAASDGREAATQAAIGTLPLLAALGIGIVIAVAAVIAFLHLTIKGREGGGDAGWTEDETGEGGLDDQADLGVTDLDESEEDTTVLLGDTQMLPALSDEEMESGPRLCGAEGEFRGLTFRITDGGLLIGRDPTCCDVVFPVEAGEVSRRHCALHFEPEKQLFYLEDLGSSNGTFLADGRRLQPGQRYPLQAGDKFSLSGKVHWFAVRC
jgi:hypothetical protein